MSDLGLAKERLGRALQEQLRAAPGRRGLIRCAVPAPAVDLPRWLAANPGTPRFYWSERGGAFEWAGIGVADALVATPDDGAVAPLTRLAARLPPGAGELRYFGGLCCDG